MVNLHCDTRRSKKNESQHRILDTNDWMIKCWELDDARIILSLLLLILLEYYIIWRLANTMITTGSFGEPVPSTYTGVTQWLWSTHVQVVYHELRYLSRGRSLLIRYHNLLCCVYIVPEAKGSVRNAMKTTRLSSFV